MLVASSVNRDTRRWLPGVVLALVACACDSPSDSAQDAGSGGDSAGAQGGVAGSAGAGTAGASAQGGTAASAGAGTAALAGGADTGEGIPPLHVDGPHFADPEGNVVILRGIDLIDLREQETERGEMTIRRMIDFVSDSAEGWYPRVLRFTVLPENWEADPPSYFTDYLKPAVDYATQKRLYAIVDWHHFEDAAGNDESTRAFWSYVGPEFASYTNVLYELYNEPVDLDWTWADWKALAQPWVDLVRALAPDNIILIGGPQWSQLIGGASDDPFVGTNLAYVGHVYPEISPEVWDADGPIAQAASAHPVMITEWGYRLGGNLPTSGTQTDFGDPFKEWVQQTGLSWSAWVADYLWQPEMFYEDYSLRTGDDHMGGFVKEWLAEKRDDDLPAGL